MPAPAPDTQLDAPTLTGEQAVFHAFRDAGVDVAQAYNATQSIRDMAAVNLIARFEAKLDAQNALIAAQNAKLDAMIAAQNTRMDAVIAGQNAKLDAVIAVQNAKMDAMATAQAGMLAAQNTKLKMLMWMLGGGAIGIVGILIRLFV